MSRTIIIVSDSKFDSEELMQSLRDKLGDEFIKAGTVIDGEGVMSTVQHWQKIQDALYDLGDAYQTAHSLKAEEPEVYRLILACIGMEDPDEDDSDDDDDYRGGGSPGYSEASGVWW